MLKSLSATRIPILIGALAVVALAAAEFLMPKDWRDALRELGFDQVLAADHALRPAKAEHAGLPVVVVDIDRRALQALGPWPWPRATIARLLDAIAAAKPAAVAIDILFADHNPRSSDATSRQSGGLAARPELTALADKTTEGDQQLAQAGREAPLVLGFVLDPERSGSLPQVPIITRNAPRLDELWAASGAAAPLSLLTERAGGLGALSLPASGDGVVRYAPLLVGVGGQVLPGLAIESIRVARGGSAYLLQADPLVLATADVQIPLSPDALLRLVPRSQSASTARTVSALDVLEGRASAGRLTGAIVLLGGSAPELGGLRETVGDPLTPSVQIQANAVEQIRDGRFPRPIGHTRLMQTLLVLVLGALALAASLSLSPVLGTIGLATIILVSWAGAVASSMLVDRLIDPLTPSLAGAAVFAIASITSFAVTQRREALVRQRFEQHLAPAVVRRIVEHPTLVKLTGERREVTSLFTDVEGFTALTHRADAEALVDVLDHYFEGIAALIVEHGGMVDKIVGDAVHALFNAPLDLAGHPRQAVACAVALRAWTASYRKLPGPAAIRFGRTRIGIETGEAIVGDVGLRSKLDYTAYGDAVNAAARLEAANKELGSSICIGPAAAARCDPTLLRPLGTIVVRGRDEPLAVFEPWPPESSAQWRERYRAAFALAEHNPSQAAAAFDELAAEYADDPVPKLLAARIRARAANA
jgi:adenylate cyclase